MPSETETWLFIVEKIICVLSFFHFNPINAIRQSRGSKVEYSHDGLKSISVKFRGHLVHFSSSAMPGLSLLSLRQNNKNERTSYLLSCITHPYLNSCCFRVEIFGHTWNHLRERVNHTSRKVMSFLCHILFLIESCLYCTYVKNFK